MSILTTGVPSWRSALERYETTAMWLTAAGLFAFSICVVLDRHFIGHTSALFWDLPVYVRAVDLLANGQNPYNSALLHELDVPSWLYFISPPAVMSLFAAIAKTPLRHVFEPLLVVLHFASMIGTPLLLGRLLFGRPPARIALAGAAFLTVFVTAGVGAFSAMNNGSILYLVIIAASLPGFARKNWAAFHLAVLVAMMFKPYYVFFWIVPVLAHGFSWRQALIGAGGTALAIATYALPAWLAPDLFDAWAANVMRTLSIGNVGENVFGALTSFLGGVEAPWLPYLGQLVYIAFLSALLLFARMRGPTLWAALLMSAVFMNPRPLVYDIAPAAIPLAYLVATFLPPAISLGWRLMISTACLTVFMLGLSYHDWLVPAQILFPALVGCVLLLATLRAGLNGRPASSIGPAWDGWQGRWHTASKAPPRHPIFPQSAGLSENTNCHPAE